MKIQPTVYVIDDDAGMRKSLQLLMESATLPTRLFDSAEEFLEELDPKRPGCIVLDLNMPRMSGIELLQRLSEMRIDFPVIVISGHADVPAAVRSMKLGAIDLLPKPFEPRALLDAVRRALEQSVDLHRLRTDEEAVRSRFAALTPRELDLLKLVVGGRSNKQIAADLRISIKTVANHRASLMGKTQAANGPELVRLSMIAGIRPSDRAA